MRHSTSKLFVSALVIVFVIFMQTSLVENAFPSPTKESPHTMIYVKVLELGAPIDRANEISLAIFHAANISGLHPMLIVSLMKSESDFKEKAVSRKNYHGLMQVPYPIYDPHVNTLLGTRILQEKLRITKGNLTKAVCKYKGWDWSDPKGKATSKRVIRMYHELKDASLWETTLAKVDLLRS